MLGKINLGYFATRWGFQEFGKELNISAKEMPYKIYSPAKAHGYFPYAGSDHDLSFITFKQRKIKILPKLITYRNLKAIQPKKFSEDFSCFKLDSLDPITTSISTCDSLNLHIINTQDKHAPIKTRNGKGKLTPWYSSEITDMTNSMHIELTTQRYSPDHNPSQKQTNLLQELMW